MEAFKLYVFERALPQHYPHKGRVVEFSPDGLLLAVGSDSAPLTYNLSHPAPTLHKEFNGHAREVRDLSFSSDSRLLASSSNDFTIRLWNVSTGSFVKALIGHNHSVLCVKFNRQSNVIASGSIDETVSLWDVSTGACLTSIPTHWGAVNAVDFSPDGSMIVACCRGGLCRIWDTATGNTVATIKADKPSDGSVKFSSDGKFVLVGNKRHTLGLWNMDSGRFEKMYGGHVNMLCELRSTFLGPDEKYIVSGSEDGCLCIWEVESARMVQKLVATQRPVLSVSCHPTRNIIASAALDDFDTVKIWTQDY